MPRIVIAEFMDAAAVDTLRQRFDVLYDPALVDQRERLLAEAAQADALIVRNRTQVRGVLLDALRQARVVGRLGVGLDNIDMEGCRARGITVIPATGANALAVAEYVVGTAMFLLRGAYLSTTQVAAGQWPRTALSGGRETAGKTLGLIGFGGIGQLTAALAQAVGMRVVAHDPMLTDADPVWALKNVRPLGLDALLAQADVVSLHVPLTDVTRSMLNAERIATMRKGAVLINTARGGICDEATVAQALHSGHLGGAAFDVFDPEPLPTSNPWANCPNLLLTPHIAGVTAEANERVSTLIADKVAAALENLT